MRGNRFAVRASGILAWGLVLALWPSAANGQVQVREDKIVLPTYEIGPPEPNPIFYSGRAYQGAKGPVYPYPFLDKITDTKRDRAYRILYLENEYVRIGVLPEIGGRIFEALDKTNGYHFFYRQQVIKPALIGMLGAWISGGVEWNIPHHHRATSFMPVDSGLRTSSDGSATLWIGEIELRHRMKWLVGLTLRPGSSVLKVTTKVFNRTPLAHSMLAFANVAVHTNEDYQVFFPPSTGIATFHGKNQFSRWPVSTEIFNGQDYTKGVDISWWKSHARPTSFFAFECQEDFFGGYDHGRQAGVVFVGDHHVVTGKKMWTWGTGSEGRTWERILTDDDGPYLELMIGAWSDNQPDYSWMRPGERREINQFWYPVRGLGGLKNANPEAACDLAVEGDRARIAMNATAERKGARCVLRSGERTLFEIGLDIGPALPFQREVRIPAGVEETSLVLELFDAEGRKLIDYAPKASTTPPLPPPVAPPPAPDEVPNAEELYLWGLRLEQFHNPAVEPAPYYEEALRRDPSDSRVNTALALLDLKKGRYLEAEGRLERAAARLTFNYTRPKDGESQYYLGLARRRLGKLREAEDAFERAAWDSAWRAVSLRELAEMAARAGDLERALDYANESLDVGRPDLRTINFLTALHRRAGDPDQAAQYADYARRTDPLDAWCLHEQYLLERDRNGWMSEPALTLWVQFMELIDDSAANRLELGLDYVNAGLWAEAAAILATAVDWEKGASDPLSLYLLAYSFDRAGLSEKVLPILEQAAALPPDLVFPHALEFIDVLEWAAEMNPADGQALYFLGNLLFDLQPERAVDVWERARQRGCEFSVLHRNLGLAYARIRNDLPSALSSLERALASNPKDARLYYELDVLSEAADVDAEDRLSRLVKGHDVVAGNDNALGREVGLLLLTGRPERALEILRGHHFHVWEGGGEIHGLWVEANLAAGRAWLDKNVPQRAYDSFMAALSYPENLDVGPPSSGPGSPKIFYFLGRAQELRGRRSEAADLFGRAAGFPARPSEQSYYRGLALSKLGRAGEAAKAFEDLVHAAREGLAGAPAMDFFEKFGERRSAAVRRAQWHFLAGLGLMGMNKATEAAGEFAKALALDPNHLEARRFAGKEGGRS